LLKKYKFAAKPILTEKNISFIKIILIELAVRASMGH